jgi:hypothetical protein
LSWISRIAKVHLAFVLAASLPLLTASTAFGQSYLPGGVISGTVVNASDDQLAPCQAEVVLRIEADGQFIPFRETQSDAQGRFRFERLPVGDGYCYLAGGNRHGMHYPGPRVQLNTAEPQATIELKVYDAAEGPSPLVLKKCEIWLKPEADALRVTERMLIDNPSNTSYVGQSAVDGDEPVTLQLAIPAGVERTTFDKEFFGRRFAVKNGKLTTGIPWPPGQRELQYTYVLRNAGGHRLWERPLDLPCADLVVRVRTDKPDEVACDLPPLAAEKDGEVAYRSDGELPAGHLLRIAVGRAPVPWTTYARWTAVGLLLTAVAGAGYTIARGSRRAPGVSPGITSSGSSIPGLTPGARHNRPGARQRSAARGGD